MSTLRHTLDDSALVRFWTLDLPKGSSLDWSASSWPRLAYSCRGAMWASSGAERWLLPPDRGLWVPAGQELHVTFSGPLSLRTVYLHPRLRVDREGGTVQVKPLLRELMVEACAVGPLLRSLPAHRRLAGVLVDRIRAADPLPGSLPLPSSKEAVAAAGRALADVRLTPDRLAEAAGLSRRSLERRFLHETGLGLGRWLQRARMLDAVRRMAEGATVGTAAWQVGYSSPSAFTHAFRKQFGYAPSGRLEGRW